jgi:hypothetical protein
MTFNLGHTAKNYKPNNDIYTPPYVFKQLGLEFDLDVCAPEGGLPWIPAKHHYSLKEDGLAQDWFGLVWCNPPYSAPKNWVTKFIDHNNGIMLAPFSKANWFCELWNKADGISLRGNQSEFIKPTGEKYSIFMPTAFFSVGKIATEALIKAGFSKVR